MRSTTSTDDFLNALPEDERAALRRWAYRRRSREIAARLHEIREEYAARGVELPDVPSDRAIDRWYAAIYPPGTELLLALDSIQPYSNIENPLVFAEYSLTRLVNLSQVLHDDFNEPSDEGRLKLGVAYQLVQIHKEIRTAATALHEARRTSDRKADYLNAAYRFAEVAETRAKAAGADVSDVIAASLAQIEAEQENL